MLPQLLDRGYGRPSQTINQGTTRTELEAMSEAELKAFIQRELEAAKDVSPAVNGDGLIN